MPHRALEIAVACRNHPHVDPDRFHSAQPLELPLLEGSQELDLSGWGQLTHLVQEQCPPIGELEAALLLLPRVREGSRFVAEELRLDEGVRQRATVDFHEGPLGPRRVVVDRVSDHLLPRPRLATDHDGRRAACDLGDLLVDVTHLAAVADDVSELVPLPQLLAELVVLHQQPLPLGRHQRVNPDGLTDHRGHDPQQLCFAREVSLPIIGQCDAETAGGLSADLNRDTHEAQLLECWGWTRGRSQRRALSPHSDPLDLEARIEK